MGFSDKLKGALGQARTKASDAVDKHGDKINGGIDKAARFADEKTKGKYSDKIAKGTTKAKETLDKIDDRNDGHGGPGAPGTPGGPAGPVR
ncbi:antitoxin [Nocardioides zeae]|uniref:Antitoxin n=1 Tax=Nocardioides imazamoxiresistens TaxID=3231893 RepID=A0ABU3PXQ9_9ACTN|nr:antitoxin [Nocardioides zeae]MDT9593661.1 antitoxin [Nocardioides zeae]